MKPPPMSQLDETTPHILIVDDDTRIRELLQKYLADNGYRTSTAADAAEAQRKMDALMYDLLILDIMMPGITGLEFTAKLREADNAIPILLLTALAETEQRIEGLTLGADDYLPKPFDPKELLLRVQNILRRSGADENPIAPPEEVHFGDYLFRYERGELTRDGARITLTTREIEVLRCLTQSHRAHCYAASWLTAKIFPSAPLMCKSTACAAKLRPTRATRFTCKLCAALATS